MPAVTNILDEIQDRLYNIKEMDGYYTSVKSIKRAMLKPFDPYDLPAINLWATGVSNNPISYKVDERTLYLFIEYHSKTRERPFIDVAEELVSDVVTAINRSTTAPAKDDTESINLGGMVKSCLMNEYNYEISEGQTPYCGVLISFSIVYNCKTNNMEDFL